MGIPQDVLVVQDTGYIITKMKKLLGWKGVKGVNCDEAACRKGEKSLSDFLSGSLLLSKIFKEPKTKIRRK